MDVADDRIRTQAIFFARVLPTPGSDWFQADVFFIRAHKLLEYEVKSILSKRGFGTRNHSNAIYQLRKLKLRKDSSFVCDILSLIRIVRNSSAHDLQMKGRAFDAWRNMVHKFEDFQGVENPPPIDLEALDFGSQLRTYLCVVSVWVWLCRVNGAPVEFDPLGEIYQEIERVNDEFIKFGQMQGRH